MCSRTRRSRRRPASHARSSSDGTIREVGMPGELRESLGVRPSGPCSRPREHRSFEFAHRGPDGVRHYVTRLVPEFGPSGDVESILGVTQDVTDRKCAEEALKDADRRKDEFLATLAHELRNPLAPIRTGLHVLSMTQDPAVAVQSREMMHRQLRPHGPAHRRPDGRLADHQRQGHPPEGAGLLRAVAESALETSRSIIEASRHTLKVKLPERAGLAHRRPDPALPGGRQPAHERRQVHSRRRHDRARGRARGRRGRDPRARTPGSASRPGCWTRCSRCSPR